MNWEIGIDMYTVPCVRQSWREHAVYPRECSSVLDSDLEKWDGGGVVGCGGGSRGRGYMYALELIYFPVQETLIPHCKAILRR